MRQLSGSGTYTESVLGLAAIASMPHTTALEVLFQPGAQGVDVADPASPKF